MFMVVFDLFTLGTFNDAFNSSDYITSDGVTTCEELIGENVEVSDLANILTVCKDCPVIHFNTHIYTGCPRRNGQNFG